MVVVIVYLVFSLSIYLYKFRSVGLKKCERRHENARGIILGSSPTNTEISCM